MQERILFVGEKLVIEGNQNSGTGLLIAIPVPANIENKSEAD